MTNDRSLRDLLLESTEDMESILKLVLDSLLNRERHKSSKNDESVQQLVKMFHSTQAGVQKLLVRVPEFQAREKLIENLKKSVLERDSVIQKVEFDLKAAETALTAAVFQANTKLKAVREAEIRPVNSEVLVKLAHQISRHYSASAPLTWQQGDPTRPFPKEQEFRVSWLSNPKTHYTEPTAPVQHPALIRQGSSQSIQTPPESGDGGAESPTTSIVPILPPLNNWSPRSGHGPTATSPLVLAARGITPQVATQWRPELAMIAPSSFAKKEESLSPEGSPSLSVQISGIPGATRVAPPPLRNVEQMSSDSSSSSSSEDESSK